MARVRAFRAGVAAGAALLVAACQDDPMVTAPEHGVPVSPQQLTGLPSAEAMERAVPGFGGYYLASDGAPVVYLKQGSSRAPVERALGEYLSAKSLSASAVRVREARYGWRELEGYLKTSAEALTVPGAQFVDNDETMNRVVIGVTDMGSATEARAAAMKAGVPAEAIEVRQVEPVYNMASLQNVVDRPVRAGVQINFPGFLCSVGFNANSGSQRSFITASHCTTRQGGVENTPYWQPLQSVNGTQIATEVADPAYVRRSAGCPNGKRCRVSDASRAAYINGANQALGVIAATSARNNGSLEITGSFTITADDCTGTLGGCLPVGARVDKVGRTTGWTSGLITNTCVTTSVSGSSLALVCQTFVSAGVGSGDSGSDVFQVTSGSNVKLAGILWGGNGAGTQFVFSPLANVVRDLGPLTTH